MSATAGHREHVLSTQFSPLLLCLALVALAGLTVPLLIAETGPLTSDESLYAQEAFNIARGEGYTYTSGELVHHRAPLFPALLAADFKIAGSTIEGGHWLTKVFALGTAAVAVCIGWRFFGQWTGMLAGAITLASALMSVIGTSLFLDGVQAFFLLVTLLLVRESLIRDSARWSGAAGIAFALAFLTKESSLLWAPLPLLALFLSGQSIRRPGALLGSFYGATLAIAGWWWVYVYAVTGQVYLLGDPVDAALAALLLGAAAIIAGALVTALVVARTGAVGLNAQARWITSACVVLAWGGLFLVGLEQHSGWPYPNDYLSNVPAYVSGVLWVWLYPLPVIALAWCYAAYRAARGSLSDQLLVLAALLFVPFALFVANRHLHVRDMLPIVALSYIVLARAAVDGTRAASDVLTRSLLPAAGGALAVVLLLSGLLWFTTQEAFRFTSYQLSFDKAVDQSNWDNPLVHEAAGWMRENLPADARVMSGRLYHSHLYMLTDGRYEWWQLPTVRVEFEDGRLTRASTLFRWEDHKMPTGDGEPWVYLRQYPEKLYYIALSQGDLLDGLREHEVDYVVVTGDDAGFSSLGLLPFFLSNSAFALEASFVDDASDQIHVFSLDRSLLAPVDLPALVDERTVAAIERSLGEDDASALLEGLSPSGYVTSSSDLAAAIEGGRQ